ncbi:MAG TPA: hypothetical protein VNZ43_13285 [Sphingomonadaceae bacterium]|nr:hypothetical protein [Sphingomonadaceae bacterium]
MKFVSTVALGAALAFGGIAMGGAMPAMAKDKAPSFNISKGVRESVSAAQEAVKKQDWATAQAKIDEALAASSTPDDKYVANSVLYDIARGTNDQAKQSQAIEGMLASGKVEPAKQAQFYLVAGNLAYQAKDYKRAETLLDQSIKLGGAPIEAYALDAESKENNGNPAGAVDVLVKAAAAQKAAGQKLPSDYYGRGIAIGYKAKLAPQVQALTLSWLQDYPTIDNWRDSLITYRDLNHVDADQELDIYRLLRTIGALKGESDYYSYAEQLYLKYPGEAKAVIDEGIAKGFLKASAGSNTKMMLDRASQRVAADKADLPGAAAAAAKSPTGKSAFVTADSYLGYGEWQKAIDLYRMALQKGGVDANVVNTRLGMALARSGDTAGAKEAFSKITGARSGLAKYWQVWLDHPSTVAPAAAAPAAAPAAQPAS